MIKSNNMIELRGSCTAAPAISHSGRNEVFYTFPMIVQRLSGAADTINIVVRETALDSRLIYEGAKLRILGEVRSFNNKSGMGNKLIITVFAKKIEKTDSTDSNTVELTGTICKPPVLRVTPMGREICDVMLAVNRRYGRSDYLPCITWGRAAQKVSHWPVGTQVELTGRLQSREYIKTTDGVATQKTAFEISAAGIEKVAEKNSPDSAASGEIDVIQQV